MLPGETRATQAKPEPECPTCHQSLHNQVLRSAGGFYIGTFCRCGPYSRESGYFKTEAQAASALTTGDFRR